MAGRKPKHTVYVDLAHKAVPLRNIEKQIKEIAPKAEHVYINPDEGKAYYTADDGSDAVIDLLK